MFGWKFKITLFKYLKYSYNNINHFLEYGSLEPHQLVRAIQAAHKNILKMQNGDGGDARIDLKNLRSFSMSNIRTFEHMCLELSAFLHRTSALFERERLLLRG